MRKIRVYRIKPSQVPAFTDSLQGLGILFSKVRTRTEEKILIFRHDGLLREIFQILTKGGSVI